MQITVEFKENPALQGSFFNALMNSEMDKTIDPKAYFMYKLAELKVGELKELCDKYCMNPVSLLPAIADKLIDVEAFGHIGQLVAKGTWREYFLKLRPHIDNSLLDHNMQDINGDTMLMYAVENRYEQVVTDLISSDRCIYDIQNKNGVNALMKACTNKNYDMVFALIRTGKCNIYLKNNKGNSVFDHLRYARPDLIPVSH
jgi:hypothetical protein